VPSYPLRPSQHEIDLAAADARADERRGPNPIAVSALWRSAISARSQSAAPCVKLVLVATERLPTCQVGSDQARQGHILQLER
jgi:hypothetical protein